MGKRKEKDKGKEWKRQDEDQINGQIEYFTKQSRVFCELLAKGPRMLIFLEGRI